MRLECIQLRKHSGPVIWESIRKEVASKVKYESCYRLSRMGSQGGMRG